MKYINSLKKFLLGGFAFLAFLFSASNTFAADDKLTYVIFREDNNFRMNQYTTLPHQHVQEMYPGLSNADAFVKLVNDGNALGFNGQRWTRGIDIINDYQYGFVDMNAYETWRQANPTATSYPDLYYMDWLSSNLGLKKSIATTFIGGKFNGQDVIGNSNIVATSYFNVLVLYDNTAAGSFSFYNMDTGRLYEETSWTSFRNGSYAGESLSDKIGSMIGVDYLTGLDDQQLYFLEGDSTVIVYTITGSFVESYNFTFSAESGLSEYSLGDVIDGKVDGWSYLGWDHGPTFVNVGGIVVPEPSTYAAVLGVLALFAAYMRRK